MANEAMDRCEFERLMSRINQETSSTDRKLDILYTSRGYFSALQASRLLYAFSISTDRLKAMEMLEPRLCRMSGREARDVLGAFNIQNDKVRALDILKRYLIDTQVRDGIAYILSCFCFEDHKMKALAILRTVRADTFDHVPAGGHCIYAPVGAVCNQSRPLKPSLFQTLYEDSQTAPGQGKILVPTLARPRLLPSKYTGHPSYAYPSGRDYAEDRKFPGCGAFGKQLYQLDPHTRECPAKCPLFAHYPSGGPPLGMHFPNGAEIEQLQQDLELCRLKLSSKYQAIKILQQQLVIANKDKQLASGKSNQLQKRFIKEINQLQFELEREEGTLMKCQESWTSRFDRICQENFEHTLALKRQEDEICKLRGENKELANIFLNSPALNLERDELRALLNIKERNIYDASRINLIEDDSFQNFSVFQLSVLGSCKCSLANLGPCDCAKLAACLKKEISLLRQEVEQQKKQKEQALIVSDAYRVAFEEQLIKNRSFVLNCSKSCSDNSDMGPVNSLKIKMAKVLRCKSVSEDCLNTESKYVDSLHSEDIKDDCVRSCANLRQSVMLSLMEMVNDKTEALVHQRIVARMLASKTKHLEKKLLSYEDDPQDRSTNDDDITLTQSSGNS